MRCILVAALCLALTQQSFAGIVVLKRAWIQKFKDRATIEANFIIDHSHDSPNPNKNDGDLHFAGSAAKEIGLPTVAELVNARKAFQKDAIALIKSSAGSGIAVPLIGVWRLWFEHPAKSQIQFADFPPAKNTNPDHSFEVHPVTKVGTISLEESFDFIDGYEGHEAKKAFTFYNSLKVTVRASGTGVTMDSKKSQFNYTSFELELIGKPKKLEDGGVMVLADVGNPEDDDNPLARGIRMIFAPGTAGAKLIAGKKAGERFEAIGIPRVNLNAIDKAIEKSGTQQFTASLPYEMIVVAIKPAK
jgi:hypothetical protein